MTYSTMAPPAATGGLIYKYGNFSFVGSGTKSQFYNQGANFNLDYGLRPSADMTKTIGWITTPVYSTPVYMAPAVQGTSGDGHNMGGFFSVGGVTFNGSLITVPTDIYVGAINLAGSPANYFTGTMGCAIFATNDPSSYGSTANTGVLGTVLADLCPAAHTVNDQTVYGYYDSVTNTFFATQGDPLTVPATTADGVPIPAVPPTTVMVNGQPCTDVTVLSDAELTCTVPPNIAGTYDVEVNVLNVDFATGDISTNMANGSYTYVGEISDPELTEPNPGEPVVPGVPNTGDYGLATLRLPIFYK